MKAKDSKQKGISIHCGWGRLIFAHTYPDPVAVSEEVLNEKEGERDIAFYLTDPHIVLNSAPQSLFLDPSHTFRLEFANYQEREGEPLGFTLGPVESREELREINRIYQTLNMVPIDVDYIWHHRDSEKIHYVVARSVADQSIIGVAMGVDHMENFNDILNGCSLWSLAVDPQAEVPKIGEWLVRYLIELFRARGRERMDLSVMHDNEQAIGLYEKIGYTRVAVFAVKRRNPINQKLFVGKPPDPKFNPYARIIIDEAMRRGIEMEPLHVEKGYFRLSYGGRSISCRESLTELTSAVALSRCDDKALTRSILAEANLSVPDQITVGTAEDNEAFLEKHKSVVVKPTRGEQGKGISVDVKTKEDLAVAIDEAKEVADEVLLERFVEGKDLRIIVINGEVAAAASRKPPEISGTGEHTIRDLIERLSRRRSAATSGESSIPMDEETRRCVENAGYTLDSILPENERMQVRKAANLHTGGTIHDVTPKLHPVLANAAVEAARVLEIPVTGLDFIVPRVDAPEYVIIEANERPGLANHEPQPTAEKFIDFLFPQSIDPNRLISTP